MWITGRQNVSVKIIVWNVATYGMEQRFGPMEIRKKTDCLENVNLEEDPGYLRWVVLM